MQLTFKNTILAGLCVLPTLASAANYSVQVGAFKYYDKAKLSELEKFGGLQATQISSGLTRVRIGAFKTQAEALAAQNSIRKNGYADAYIVRAGKRIPGLAKSPASDMNRLTSIEPASGTARFIPHNLTEEEKRLGVYLDGQFRIKNGNKFMKLKEFRDLPSE